jgi:ATP-dependent Clp protease protease subunit
MSRDIEDYFDPIVVKEFDDASTEAFRKQVFQESLVDPDAPIIVYVDSYGGNVECLASMVEIINSVPNQVHTICTGKAMSAGALLLSFGDVRYCGSHSTVMVHEISAGTAGHVKDIRAEAKEIIRVNGFWLGRFAENCGFESFKEMQGKCWPDRSADRDIYLDAHQSKLFGVVDHVGVPKVALKRKNQPKRRIRKKAK